MKKIKLLVVGYSKFVEKRLINSIKKIKKIDYRVCSKSKKGKAVYYRNYLEGLNFKPDLIYISLTNHLHYKYAKIFLNKGFNVIVDKPITESLKKTLELIKIAKSKKLLLSEATLFNYHLVFNRITKILGGKSNIELLQSNFNIPKIKSLKSINATKSDCFMDMSPYAAALIRLYMGQKYLSINFDYKKFPASKNVQSFYILASNKKIKYFGNFCHDREYLSQIIFYSKKKIVFLPHQAFALPSINNIRIIIKEKNKFQKVLIKKDDCILNYLNDVLKSFENKSFLKFYNLLIEDAKIRDNLYKKIK